MIFLYERLQDTIPLPKSSAVNTSNGLGKFYIMPLSEC